ncbi:DUF948 domain-containing protein [Paenibacillus sp. YPG26]|uniref:DUF948 domain-containing protein n=1 Tax=Paenibacillus sp. YPG26 TaxID=2878915 RepID=UPI0020402D58|nr:DUF948 domain-containing protein [Paenibacillus sp. YPG26]USB31634.1 DUF948 domain-containing protein [Paenibacillus sp. YPG26]
MEIKIKHSVAGAAVGFIALNVYLIKTLKKTMGTLGEVDKTLAEVRGTLGGLSEEAKHLIRNANKITADVKGKINAVDPLLETAHDVGEVIHQVTDSVLGNNDASEIRSTSPVYSTSPNLHLKVK